MTTVRYIQWPLYGTYSDHCTVHTVTTVRYIYWPLYGTYSDHCTVHTVTTVLCFKQLMPMLKLLSHPLLAFPCDVFHTAFPSTGFYGFPNCFAYYMSFTSLASYQTIILVKLFNFRWILSCLHSVCATNHLRQFRAVVCDSWTLCMHQTCGLTSQALHPAATSLVTTVRVFLSRPQEGGRSTRPCPFGPPGFPVPDVWVKPNGKVVKCKWEEVKWR